jgi:hypothetical protein
MAAFTLRYQPTADDAEIAAAETCIGQYGGRVAWQRVAGYGRTYGLVEGAGEACAAALMDASRAAVFDRPIIALAISPSAPQALPRLARALGGPGAPDGVLACETEGQAVVLEWDLERTSAALVLGLVDVELARFNAHRANALLSPLPLAWWTRLAAEGLRAPEVAPERVLEEQLEVQRVVD